MSGRPPHLFDRFAAAASEGVSKAPFFVGCVLLVVIWLPSYFVVGNTDTWQLIINTATTIITFLLVALLQNTQRRGEDAIQAKLDAIADAIADLMEHHAGAPLAAGGGGQASGDLARDVADLRDSVGIEKDI